jgi:tetratricopeptide (TPR) repeat protein
VREKLPLVALAAAAGSVTLFAQERALVPASLPLGLRTANALGALASYLEKTLWPAGLSPLYPHPYLPGMGGEPLGAARVAGAALLLAVITALVLRSRRGWAEAGWLFTLVTLLPVIGFVQVGGQAMADRYTYVPLIGVFVIAAWGVAELDARLRAGLPALSLALRGASVAGLIALAIAAHAQARHWRDSEALWTRALAVSPGALAHYNYGLTLREQRRFGEAEAQLRQVLALDPSSARALNEIGITLERAGDGAGAERAYRDSIALGPKNARAHLLLGELLERRGERADASEHYRAALAVNPHLRGAREALARATSLRTPAP